MKATVKEVVQETSDVRTIILEPESKVEFVPGQFMMVRQEKGMIGKAYSIASPPGEDLRITFKLYKDGKISPYLWSLKIGDSVEIEAPYGHFKLQPHGKLVFISGGTGIAPMRSMAFHCLKNNMSFKMLTSFRTEDDVIYKNELENFGADVIITSKNGRINGDKLKSFDKDSIFYICGSPEMASDMESKLKNLGIDKENIRTERW